MAERLSATLRLMHAPAPLAILTIAHTVLVSLLGLLVIFLTGYLFVSE